MDSILTSTKKLLGIAEDYKHFDVDIIIHINSALMVLTQLGVGPSAGFAIEDETSTWDEFIGDDITKLQMVKSYVVLKVRLLFDPPQSSAHIDAITRQISEFEWRLYMESDPPLSDDDEDEDEEDDYDNWYD